MAVAPTVLPRTGPQTCSFIGHLVRSLRSASGSPDGNHALFAPSDVEVVILFAATGPETAVFLFVEWKGSHLLLQTALHASPTARNSVFLISASLVLISEFLAHSTAFFSSSSSFLFYFIFIFFIK